MGWVGLALPGFYKQKEKYTQTDKEEKLLTKL